MDNAQHNPFLEGSVEVSQEEAAAAAQALMEEAAAIRAKEDNIKARAAEARAQKEAARKAELKKMDAEIEAARAQIVKTVSNIPRANGRPAVRPIPPDLETTGSASSVVSNSDRFFSFDFPVNTSDLMFDMTLAAIATTFALLLFSNL